MNEPRIGLDDDGKTLDEFVLDDCSIHFEAMDTNQWWIGVYKDGRAWHINVGAINPKASAYANVWEDVLPTSPGVGTNDE